MTIGERIKDQRKKNDLTQEKLANYLNVSYQAISKWECGVSSPDLALIGPLTKLLHVSADELLGLNEAVSDARKAEFDAAYHEYWKADDKEANYRISKQAVTEYPGELRYVEWLAANEYYVAFDENYRNGGSLDYFYEMLESSLKHYLTVFEESCDEGLRENALWGIVLDLKYLNRSDEAKKYAELFPEKKGQRRDDALELCLEGEERHAHRQRMLYDSMNELCRRFGNIWHFGDTSDPSVLAALDAEEAVMKLLIPDGNYLGFEWNLYHIDTKRAQHAIKQGNAERAMDYLAKAMIHAARYDAVCRCGKSSFTCPLLSLCEHDWSDCLWEHDMVYYMKEELRESKVYDPLRERKDFKKMISD